MKERLSEGAEAGDAASRRRLWRRGRGVGAAVRILALRLFGIFCLVVALVAALPGPWFEPGLFIAYGVCAILAFWRTDLYAYALLLTLLLASFNVLHMFPSYREYSMSVSFGDHTVSSPKIDPRVLLLLVPFLLIALPILKKALDDFLRDDD